MPSATTAVAKDFDASDSKLSTLSYNQLDAAITGKAATIKHNIDDLLPYLREMRTVLSKQGRRTDLRRGAPPLMTWQRWVQSKKDLLGSLSTVNRLLRGKRSVRRETIPVAVFSAMIVRMSISIHIHCSNSVGPGSKPGSSFLAGIEVPSASAYLGIGSGNFKSNNRCKVRIRKP